MTLPPTNEDSEVLGGVLGAVNEATRYAYLSCGVEFQREQINKLSLLEERLRNIREDSIQRSDEVYSNAAFRAQLAVRGIKEFLEMWVLLKEDKASDAWDKLANSRSAFSIAQRITYDPEIEKLLKHLGSVEKVVFPFQMGCSSGYTYKEAFCSICNRQYGECDHLHGNIYMGKICRRVIRECVLRENSLTLVPQDKRCRVTDYADNGKVYCTLTRRELAQSKPVDQSAKFISGIFQRFD